MEFTALFIWLALCLLLGGAIHYVLAGAMQHRLLRLLSAPGLFARKFTMSVVALGCGATVTRASVYDLSERDIDFQADGVSSVAKALVPLVPLFGCAVLLAALNSMFGGPFHLDYSPPELASLDTGGLRGFLAGTWAVLSRVIRRGAQVDWRNPRLYVLFALTFSLALGAAASMERMREASLGAALLAIGLALVCALAQRPTAAGGMRTVGWVAAARDFIVTYSAVAFVMMVYGLVAALVVGVTVRLYELATSRGSGGSGKTRSLPGRGGRKRAA